MSEKSFQSYFMRTIRHGYRISLTTGGGFPDVLLIHGSLHSLVELKVLELGKQGDKKLSGLFKPTQPPWYMDYLSKGGQRLYVVLKLESGYGVIMVTMDFVRQLDLLYYSDLPKFLYTEHKTLKELVDVYFCSRY